jgi:hypothetical protein
MCSVAEHTNSVPRIVGKVCPRFGEMHNLAAKRYARLSLCGERRDYLAGEGDCWEQRVTGHRGKSVFGNT